MISLYLTSEQLKKECCIDILREQDTFDFETGDIYVTDKAKEIVEKEGFIKSLLILYTHSYWGGNCEKELEEKNNINVKRDKGMIMGKFIDISGGKTSVIYVITEYDRSMTIIMLEEEY